MLRLIPSSVKKYPTMAPIRPWRSGETVYETTNISAVVAEIHPRVTTIATIVFTFFFVVRSESFEYIHPISKPTKKRVVLTTMSVVVTGDTILVCHCLVSAC